jgi:hypothetical protein
VSLGLLLFTALYPTAGPAAGRCMPAGSRTSGNAGHFRRNAHGRRRRLVRLHGRVTDFEGRPLDNAEVQVLGHDFEAIAYTYTDENGMYGVEVECGTYLAAWICKDYKEKMLEYWAWHVPVYDGLELNARVDGLEVYGLNAFWPRQRSVLMVYFRPMSLKRFQAYESSKHDEAGLIDISPRLGPEDVEVTIDGKSVPLLCVNKVREQVQSNHYMDAYLVHVQADGILETDAYRKIGVAIVDRETQEKGEASVFWRYTLYK